MPSDVVKVPSVGVCADTAVAAATRVATRAATRHALRSVLIGRYHPVADSGCQLSGADRNGGRPADRTLVCGYGVCGCGTPILSSQDSSRHLRSDTPLPVHPTVLRGVAPVLPLEAPDGT